MPRPRKCLIKLSDTPYYHCVSRCVRRAFLCGKDRLTGKCYEHRRLWVENRILLLAEIFCVDVCAYAVMSNHTHLVLRINKNKADMLSVDDVIYRWHKLYKGVLLTQRYNDPCQRDTLSGAEISTVKSIAEVYRHRLYDISWFMRLLNEYIARLANKEDDCTGHFWEGRFKSQALLDETALAACMAYVDLNPVRAHLSDTLANSSHTSICKRIRAAKAKRQPSQLLPFADKLKTSKCDGLPFHLEDYFALVESTRQHFHPNKRSKIEDTVSPILTRIGLEHTDWHALVSGIETDFGTNVSHKYLIRNRSRQRTYNSA